MTEGVERSVIEPVNPKLNVSRNANLPHSPGIRVGDYIFLSGMGPVDPVSGGRNLGPIAEQIRQTLRNMAHMLESAGSGLDRIVKMNREINSKDTVVIRKNCLTEVPSISLRWCKLR
jgi:enamine deaminase RidA (YjgF/YER057c/UK114 family)